MIIKTISRLILITALVAFVIVLSMALIDLYIETDKQIAMQESWTEGYDQGYSDAYFKITGDEEPLKE